MNLEEVLKNKDGKNEEVNIQPTIPRYIVRGASFALASQKPIEWIVEPLISANSLCMVYGEPGSKKTYTLLSLAVCVALGKPWLGFSIQPRKVLIIDEESGEQRLALRLGAALRGEFGDETTQVEFVSLAGFKLDSKHDIEELKVLIANRGAGLVIIDALADVMDGDENSKQDTQPILSALRKIAELMNVAIIIIHHSNRTGSYRGSSAIKGALDLMVKIESTDNSSWIIFKTEKNRDGVAINFNAVAYWTENQFYLSETETRVKEKPLSKSQNYVLSYLKNNGASSLPDIMGSADICSESSARQAVYALVELGKIYRTNPMKNGRGAVAVYDLTKDSNEPS